MEGMEEEVAIEVNIDMEVPLTEERNRKGDAKKIRAQEKTEKKKKVHAAALEGDDFSGPLEGQNDFPPGITVSVFDHSVQNHFKAVDMISKLCGEAESDDFDQKAIESLSSSITFLREWRHFTYQPRIIRFACETESPQGKDVIGGINLPQFSSASVPKKDSQNGNTLSSESNKDFIMYVGGPIWALDWCPSIHQRPDCHIKSEFIAVAAHPPESLYHKIGAPLAGRGVIQIWCLLNVNAKEEDVSPLVAKKQKQNRGKSCKTKEKSTQPKRPRGRPRKKLMNESAENVDNNTQYVQALAIQPKRPRGRPRKKQMNESLENVDGNTQHVQALAIQFSKDSSKLPCINGVSGDSNEHVAGKKDSGKKRKGSTQGMSADNSMLTASAPRRLKDRARKRGHIHGKSLPLLKPCENEESSLLNPQTSSSCEQDLVASSGHLVDYSSLETNPNENSIPKDVVLPRVMLCLAHNGKVAWDVKWRPCNAGDTEPGHRMGYLAVLLGNGALEVWEVPFPRAIRVIYSACQKEGTDPRFIKLEPVFRCSMLKSGDRQSIPLTVEWSTSSPHEFILAGCHDGVVALWKFSVNGSCKDTRPLLCFSADTVPIRALAWAPVESDPDSANVIVTAGHKGLKFWDLRDPFRPLWDLNPVQRIIYSLDWLPEPRCVIVSFDDGTLRILSLMKAAYDVPVTGKPFVGTQQQGFHSYYCSSFTIWSVQVSRLTGMVAYCGADGTVLRFQLTTKAVEKDPFRNRAPHFLCGLLAEEESALTVITPLPGIPFPMKKSLNEWGDTPRSIRGFLSVSNQAKRAREQMAKGQPSYDQPLALCYEDDPGTEFGSDDTIVAQKSKQAPKSKASGKKKLKVDQELVCRDEEPEDASKEDKLAIGNEIEAFPPKIVAMHKVRWNMNKGSERWLCYGGAGGIVRCQEIDVSGAL